MVVVLGAAFLAGLISWFSLKESEFRKGATITWVIVVAILSFAAVSVKSTVYLNDNLDGEKVIVQNEWELVTLQDTSQMRGSFFLASGNIGDRMYYEYYYKTDDGAVQYGKVRAVSNYYGSIKIFEEDRADAVMQELRYKPEFTWNPVYQIPFFVTAKTHTVFRVPEGTVVRGVSIDITDK